LHSPSPLRSLSAARRSLSATRRQANAEDRLLLKSVSPHESESCCGRGTGSERHCDGGHRHTLQNRGRTLQPAGSANAQTDQAGPARSSLQVTSERPRAVSVSRQYHRRWGQMEPGSPLYAGRKKNSDNHAPSRTSSTFSVRTHHASPSDLVASQSVLDQQDDEDKARFQRRLGVGVERAGASTSPRERRRGYYSNLGANAPGSPLHPAFIGLYPTSMSTSVLFSPCCFDLYWLRCNMCSY
jgi:hypothetical protein